MGSNMGSNICGRLGEDIHGGEDSTCSRGQYMQMVTG